MAIFKSSKSKKDKKENFLTTKEVGEFLLYMSYEVALGMINKNRKMLKEIGFRKFDNEILIELTIFYIWLKIVAISELLESRETKEKLKNSLVDAYFDWIQKVFAGSKYVDYYRNILMQRIKTYGEAYLSIEENLDNDKKESLFINKFGETLLEVWKNILDNSLDSENIIDTMRLTSFFINSKRTNAKATIDFISRFKIIA